MLALLADLDLDWLVSNKELLAIVAGFIGTLLSIRRQTGVLQTQVALEFFRRYSEITKEMPDRLRLAKYQDASADIGPEERSAILRSMIQYANLCSEEFALWEKRRIPKDIWSLWTDGITENFEAPLWRSAWLEVSREYESYAKFSEFMRSTMERAAKHSQQKLPR